MWFWFFLFFIPIWTYLGIQFSMRFSVLADFACGFAVLDEFFFGFALSSIPQCPPRFLSHQISLYALLCRRHTGWNPCIRQRHFIRSSLFDCTVSVDILQIFLLSSLLPELFLRRASCTSIASRYLFR